MLLKVKIENRATKNGGCALLIHDYTLRMVIYTFAPINDYKAATTGKIEVQHLDSAIKNAAAFRTGLCDVNEQFSIDTITGLLNHAKTHSLEVSWSKA